MAAQEQGSVRVLIASARARVILPGATVRSAAAGDERYRFEPVVTHSAHALEDACIVATPRLLLVDTELATALGAEGLQRIRAGLPGLRTMIVCTHAEAVSLPLEVLKSVRGCLTPLDNRERVLRALDTVLAGHLWFPRIVLEWMIQAAEPPDHAPTTPDDSGFDTSSLTPREAEVHALMRQGLSNPQIAERIEVSVNTVKKHLENVFRKLGLRKRRQDYT
jgi:DNA-binding NarL/FixJ family response regulator